MIFLDSQLAFAITNGCESLADLRTEVSMDKYCMNAFVSEHSKVRLERLNLSKSSESSKLVGINYAQL